MTHAAFTAGNTAVVTGAASGIGLAATTRFAEMGMNVVLTDLAGERLDAAARTLADDGRVVAIAADVADRQALSGLADAVVERFGPVHVLVNNAGIQPGSTMFGPLPPWEKVMAVNLWGVIHGARAFAPGMIAHGQEGLIINTGSKQGITTPPGDPAYNIAKAGVKVFTEALQHELRNTQDSRITAHLLIPGFVFTGLTANGRTEKPADAWTSEQTVDFMLDSIGRGDFYILCPDNAVSRATDEKRILWAAGDIAENRPALSRWHPDHAGAFKAWLDGSET